MHSWHTIQSIYCMFYEINILIMFTSHCNVSVFKTPVLLKTTQRLLKMSSIFFYLFYLLCISNVHILFNRTTFYKNNDFHFEAPFVIIYVYNKSRQFGKLELLSPKITMLTAKKIRITEISSKVKSLACCCRKAPRSFINNENSKGEITYPCFKPSVHSK
jgi:hypothetical protein